jgi:hypothetical protein
LKVCIWLGFCPWFGLYAFNRELYLGTTRQYSQNLDDIEFENGKRFQKVSQTVYPEKFVQWINGDNSNKFKSAYKNTKRFRKGQRRWQDLPKPLEVNTLNIKIIVYFSSSPLNDRMKWKNQIQVKKWIKLFGIYYQLLHPIMSLKNLSKLIQRYRI